MNWTKQQENAIKARNSSLIVSAAAGSGKTAVLTERLAQLLSERESGVRADRIVVVTFTNDAASELKKRLDAKLHELINSNPSDTHLLRQQVLLQSAKISTINAFCFDILRDNMTEQGVTSGFNVMDTADETVLKSQAMDELIDYYSKEEYEKISYLYDNLCLNDDRNIREAVSSISEFLSSEAFRDRWLDKAIEEYKKGFEKSIYAEKVNELCLEKMRLAKKLSDECVALVPELFADMRENKAVNLKKQAEEENERISDYLRIFESGRLPNEDESKTASKYERIKTIPNGTEKKNLYTSRRKEYIELVKESVDAVLYSGIGYEKCVKLTEYLAEAVKKYHDIIREHKEEKNALSFDDGERLVLELLSDFDENGKIVKSETAERLSEYYDIIMIDEYQDSNNKQDMIFKLLSKNADYDSDGNLIYGDNVFLVGDVKQSIYGFRLANPKNFIATLEKSERYTEDSTAPNKFIALNQNFRSSPEVIDFVNYLFSVVMSVKCGDIEYSDDEKLYFGAGEYAKENGKQRKTHIAFIPADESNSEKNTELEYTVNKIASMLREGVPVEIEKGKTRPCCPSDFCVLVRNNKFSATYAKALNDAGIPAKGSEEKGYLKSREIAVLIDLLRIINDPLLDIPLSAVLTSPMYMFTANELAYIKSFDRERRLYSLLRDIADGGYEESFENDSLLDRIKAFLSAFDKFRLDSVTMTVGELITSIYDTTDFISVMQVYRDGEKKRANLRSLVLHASNYEASASNEGSGGLGGFLRHLDRILSIDNADLEQGKIAASSGDYVRVQTYHASKGLEYKFVFIAETDVSFNYDSKDATVCSSDGRTGYIVMDSKNMRRYKTIQRDIINDEKKSATKSEEMRLLYVGLTRAKQQLFINLKVNEAEIKKLETITEQLENSDSAADFSQKADSFSYWLWLAVMVHPKYGEIADGLELPQFNGESAKSDDDLFEFEVYSEKEENDETDEKIIHESLPNFSIISELEAVMNSEYDDSLTKMPAKMSVTQISHRFTEEKSFDFKLQRPAFIGEISRLTGAERGTAMHTFFQYCNFENAINSPADEVQRLSETGYLNSGQVKAIKTDKISAFFRSDLFKRVVSADSYTRERKFMVAVSQLELENELKEKLKKSDGMIKGIIDLMFEENGEIVIVDYKSDRGISEKALADRYRTQLKLYKSAVEITTGKPVKELYLYSIELEKAIKL